MTPKFSFLFLCLSFSLLAGAQFIEQRNTDPRFIENGYEIPSFAYTDQPYIVVCNDGSWLCAMTTSFGIEGAYMNFIASTKSYDQGQTWTKPVYVESPGVPQSAWAVPVKIPSGRIYLFYNYNKHGFKGLEGVMSGPFMFKYSDDHGQSWSEKRFEAPIRTTTIDKENYTGGEHQFFWSIDKPVVTENAVYIAFTKILRATADQKIFLKSSDGFLLKSENILTEKDPVKIKWETLPEDDTGIRNPDMGRVQAEHNLEVMNNGDLYMVYRTIDGSPAYSISRDGGRTFSRPQYMTYANGERIGNTRACPKIHKTENGKYLFWFHNNFRQNTYHGRNPAWLSGGIEKNGDIEWSQPEIVVYDDDPNALGMSYPDYIEQDGKLWISETQKNIARVHPIDQNLLLGLWSQGNEKTVLQDGLIMSSGKEMMSSGQINFPPLPELADGGGFTLELWLKVDEFQPGQQLFSTIGMKHNGITIGLQENNSIEIEIADGIVREDNVEKNRIFVSDQNTIIPGKLQHVVFIIDGAAKIATIITDGYLSDGSENTRAYGWARVYPYLKTLNDTYTATFNDDFKGSIEHMRIYNRALKTSEAIGNHNAGLD